MRFALPLVLVIGCFSPEPPSAQFYCMNDSNCPDGFVCEIDLHCYDEDRIPGCFIYGEQAPELSTGCAAGEGCYWGTSEFGPVCQQRGFIGQYGTGCDLIEVDSPLERRCAPGHVCVPPDNVFLFENTCLRICDVADPCTDSDECILRFPISERNTWWLGNELRFCFPTG